jgi:hypothetical protein
MIGDGFSTISNIVVKRDSSILADEEDCEWQTKCMVCFENYN